MALPDITIDDFEGYIKIVINEFKTDDLEYYILQFQEQYLREIIGDSAYFAIQNEDRTKWDDLLNGVDYVGIDGKMKNHKGLVKPITQFIYFEFVRDNFTATQPGQVQPSAENSERYSGIEVTNIARSRYNNAIFQTRTTPSFLNTYQSIEKEVTSSVDNADNTYTLSIPSTFYLQEADLLEINKETYVALEVVENSSVKIEASETGLDFTGDLVLWKPFEQVEYCQLDICSI